MDDLFSLPYILIPALGNLKGYTSDYDHKMYFIQANGALFVFKHPISIERDSLVRTVKETLGNEYLIRLK